MYRNLIPGIIYACLVFTMSISFGVFLALSVQTVDATRAPFIIGKLLSTFEDEFVFLFFVKFLPVYGSMERNSFAGSWWYLVSLNGFIVLR